MDPGRLLSPPRHRLSVAGANLTACLLWCAGWRPRLVGVVVVGPRRTPSWRPGRYSVVRADRSWCTNTPSKPSASSRNNAHSRPSRVSTSAKRCSTIFTSVQSMDRTLVRVGVVGYSSAVAGRSVRLMIEATRGFGRGCGLVPRSYRHPGLGARWIGLVGRVWWHSFGWVSGFWGWSAG